MSPTILQEGRQACLAMELATSAAHAQPGGPVYLRDIAQDLERLLLRDPECAVHWIAVVDEPSSFGAPTRIWEHDDSLLQVSLAQGHSEGMLVYVYAQANRYKPAELVPLLRIKLLCGVERALMRIPLIAGTHSRRWRAAFHADRGRASTLMVGSCARRQVTR